MSYNIGQLRQNQISSYSEPITGYDYQVGNSSELTGYKSYIGSTAVYDSYIGIKGSKFEKDKNYYLSFSIDSWNQYHFKVKLVGDGISMIVKEFKTSGSEICELVFTPNDDNYNMIVLEKIRTDISNDRGGIVINRKSIQLKSLINIISRLNSRYNNLSYLKKMGLQAPSGFLFSMNGEEFYMGKSGIYEIQDINITNLSFVIRDSYPESDGKQRNYLIMDFQY